MQARIKNPALTLPGSLDAIYALLKATEKADLPPVTTELVNLRASQINGCSVCVDIHTRALKKLGEKDNRIFCVAAWREAPYYSEAERAALELSEAVTRIADRSDAVPDEVWNEAAKHYSEIQLSALLVSIGIVNLFNRINAATRQPTGDYVQQIVDRQR
jgi:AhpD family alkylhydroperoxidase